MMKSLILVGNKSDLGHRREISENQLQRLGKKFLYVTELSVKESISDVKKFEGILIIQIILSTTFRIYSIIKYDLYSGKIK